MDRTVPLLRNSNRAMPGPLGPVITDKGILFSLYSEHATQVELCLFETPSATTESQRIALDKGADSVWRVHVPNLKADCLYGYRVHGPYRPAEGHRFNPSKLLLDPYAKALGRTLQWHDSLWSVPPGTSDQNNHPPDTQDSAPYAPLAKVMDTAFDWGEDRSPKIPWEETIIYETHVKGMTQQHPNIPEELRGTYAGLASESVLEHLTRMGVTSIELLPVHQIADEYHLHANGLTNYWGYNPLLFFAPDARFTHGKDSDPATEFKKMVRAFHQAGIEVILDMVFNHTAEGNLHGPTLSFRGIDNAVYYRTHPSHPERYADFTGCGNTFNLNHPQTRQLVLDVLRYWIGEMHVDGFRLDLAVTVGRERKSFRPDGKFFKSIHQDPLLSQVKWIAEPWDLGPRGYQLSNFPKGWSEWNDQYRQTVRKFWRGDSHEAHSLTQRVMGSHDLFGVNDRPLHSTINYITSHDGFTLADLVTYQQKHNEANRENNHDGHNGDESCNYGVEGPSDDPALNTLRQQQKRNLLATLLLSSGTPMISGGDEIGRTQQGNNNSYCQDNPISWYDWNLNEDQKSFLEFTRLIIQLRKRYPFTQTSWQWFRHDGQTMAPYAEEVIDTRCLGCISSDNENAVLLILWNSGDQPCDFSIPGDSKNWKILLDTSVREPANPSSSGESVNTFNLAPNSLRILTGTEE
jgi:glycogen operon protein